MSVVTLATLLGAALLVFGALLLRVGFRGRRVDNHPICAACAFDLIGLPQRSRCPECGADLSAESSVRTGWRRPHAGALACGLLLLLTAISLLGSLGYFSATHRDWNTLKPTWLLVREVRASDDPLRISRTTNELIARFKAGRVARDSASEIVDVVLDRQRRAIDDIQECVRSGQPPANGEFPQDLLALWLPLFDAAASANEVSPEQAVRYAKAVLMNSGATVRSRAASNGWTHFDAYACDNMGVGSRTCGLGLRWCTERAEIDGDEIPVESDVPKTPIWNTLGGWWEGRLLVAAPPGKRTLTITWRFDVYLRGSTEPVGSFRRVQRTPLLVLPAGSRATAVRSEPAGEGRDAIRQVGITLEDDLEPMRLSFDVEVGNHSAPIIGRVELRLGGKSWPLGTFRDDPKFSRWDLTDSVMWNEPCPAGFDPDALFQLAIIPDLDMAERETCVEEVWGQEIVIPGVRVQLRTRPPVPSSAGGNNNARLLRDGR